MLTWINALSCLCFNSHCQYLFNRIVVTVPESSDVHLCHCCCYHKHTTIELTSPPPPPHPLLWTRSMWVWCSSFGYQWWSLFSACIMIFWDYYQILISRYQIPDIVISWQYYHKQWGGLTEFTQCRSQCSHHWGAAFSLMSHTARGLDATLLSYHTTMIPHYCDVSQWKHCRHCLSHRVTGQ